MRVWWLPAAASLSRKFSLSKLNGLPEPASGQALIYYRIMAKLEVTLVRSTATRPYFHRKIVAALGFHRLHETRVLPDNAATRGMIAKIPHMLEWKEVKEGASR